MAELRVTGIDDSVTFKQMAAAVVGANEVSMGMLRTTSRGYGAVWFSCSLTAARRIVAEG
jgi:hypothetical protein